MLPSERQIFVRNLDCVELWSVGEAQAANGTDPELQLSTKPACLLRLQALHGQTILCAAASFNGKFLTYSTQTSGRFFAFDLVSVLSPFCSIVFNWLEPRAYHYPPTSEGNSEKN